jgi:hypothetical protein
MSKNYRSVDACVHAFANFFDAVKFSASGQSASVSFRNGALYSYAEPIARYVETKAGATVVLIHTGTWSNTTSKHQSKARHALSHYTQIRVPSLSTFANDVFSAFERECKPVLDKLAKARKPIIYLDTLADLAENARKYAEATGNKIPKPLAKLFSIKDGTEATAIFAKERKAQDKAKREEAARRAIEDADRLEKFRAREVDHLYTADGLSHLRINNVERRIETSQGVQIGLGAARALWQGIQQALATGDYSQIIGSRILDSFTVRNLTPAHIEIGCHTITHGEINAIADQMRWTSEANAAGTIPAPAEAPQHPAL